MERIDNSRKCNFLNKAGAAGLSLLLSGCAPHAGVASGNSTLQLHAMPGGIVNSDFRVTAVLAGHGLDIQFGIGPDNTTPGNVALELHASEIVAQNGNFTVQQNHRVDFQKTLKP